MAMMIRVDDDVAIKKERGRERGRRTGRVIDHYPQRLLPQPQLRIIKNRKRIMRNL